MLRLHKKVGQKCGWPAAAPIQSIYPESSEPKTKQDPPVSSFLGRDLNLDLHSAEVTAERA